MSDDQTREALAERLADMLGGAGWWHQVGEEERESFRDSADELLPTVQRLIAEAVAEERRRVVDSFQIRSLDPS